MRNIPYDKLKALIDQLYQTDKQEFEELITTELSFSYWNWKCAERGGRRVIIEQLYEFLEQYK